MSGLGEPAAAAVPQPVIEGAVEALAGSAGSIEKTATPAFAAAAPEPRSAVDTALWRALGFFRSLALLYAITRFAASYNQYAHIGPAIVVLFTMSVWTAWTGIVYHRTTTPRRALLSFLAADLAVGAAAVLSTVLVDTPTRIQDGALTLPTVWSSAPVIAAAIALGWRGGVGAAALMGGADLLERGALSPDSIHNIVLMVLTGAAIGYVTELGRTAELTLVRAQRLEAATRERQRLARDIHDGVLQVLALVQRRGAEIGGAGRDLGLMAGEQELALRALVHSWHEVEQEAGADGADPVDPVDLDLCALLGRLTGPRVTLAGPGAPVALPSPVAREVAAAAAAALDNVRAHGGPGADGLGARAWILVEDEGDGVIVTVRDDGPGIPEGRLEEARRAGRLGVAHSIRGRLADVGGSVEVVSIPGQGTEVEMRVPRPPVPRGAAPSVSALRKALR
ncbi:signal transduction histidine kinase [Catenulispora sp. MAP5-51]|uniref:MacS family sensor histidine kinase n=1 Tax=Catenulispora sp. MAP5-51 TaxID=3156298 RepID=UPI0035164363